MAELVQVVLNAFVRKTNNSDALKVHIRSTGAKLARKGRSRNWQLSASNEQVLQIVRHIHQSGENSWLWLAKKLNEVRPQLSHAELLNIARQETSITVTELVSLTDCSLADARKVLDDIEWE